ncbi:MAG: M3 family metallopeptidase [Eubacteriales bacterium]|nr:M3 family metallopeptidase [Eubacteriales bacterium]
MENQYKFPKRSEVPESETWDISRFFKDDASYHASFDAIEREALDFAASYKHKLADLDSTELHKALVQFNHLISVLGDLQIYANSKSDVDLGNQENAKLCGTCSARSAQISSGLSFFTSEFYQLSDEKLDAISKLDAKFAGYVREAKRMRPHLLAAETEEVLSALGQSLQLPMTCYETTKMADMSFENFEANGKSYENSYVLYENSYAVSDDAALRRQSFASFNAGLHKYRNTTATLYNAHVQQEKVESRLRGYDSVFDFLLNQAAGDADLYNRQIDVIMRDFAPVMRRYARLLKKALKLDKLYYADLRANLFDEGQESISIPEAKSYILDAITPMGPEYSELVSAFDRERWVDFAMNQGKMTGGYCGASSEGKPFVLLSWNGTMSELYTLAHELGHGANFILAYRENSILQGELPLSLVEAPSTFHELLLSHALFQRAKTDEERARVQASMLAKTYFHNFVTHLLEADFQRKVYRAVDAGEQLSADDFDALTRETQEQFWGDAVELESGVEMTWMRQPHYYMGLYSYTYSAGLTLATQTYLRLQKPEEASKAISDWLAFLKLGGSLPVQEAVQVAGSDFTNDAALKSTIAFLDETVSDLERFFA